ncbi:MAG: hypothetical protein OEZ06_31020 [Myxococcales bacterium]|nr:hypothetical protein [Myxococcales bacterium]
MARGGGENPLTETQARGLAADQLRREQVGVRHLERTVGLELGNRVEPRDHLRRALGTCGGIKAEQLHHQRVEFAWQLGNVVRRWQRARVRAGDRFAKTARGKGAMTGERPVGQGPQTKEITAPVQGLAEQQLGCRIAGRADQQLIGAHRRQRAEIQQLGATVFGAAHVVRAQVPMHQPPRVQQGQDRGDVAQ